MNFLNFGGNGCLLLSCLNPKKLKEKNESDCFYKKSVKMVCCFGKNSKKNQKISTDSKKLLKQQPKTNLDTKTQQQPITQPSEPYFDCELILPVQSISNLSFNFDDIQDSNSLIRTESIISEFDTLVQKHSCDFTLLREDYAFMMQPPKADMTPEITEILGVDEAETRRMLHCSGDNSHAWAGSAFDLLADKHHCDMGDVRDEMRRAIEASSRAPSALSMAEELFFNDWPELLFKYSLNSMSKTDITAEDLENWNSHTSDTTISHGKVSLPPSVAVEVEPEEPFTLLFNKDDHPELKSCTSVGEFAHYIVKRAAGGLDDEDKDSDWENFGFIDERSLIYDETVSMATSVKTGVMSRVEFRNKAKIYNEKFANSLMIDALKEEEELGKEVSFFDYIDDKIMEPKILNTMQEETTEHVNKVEKLSINSKPESNHTENTVKTDKLSTISNITETTEKSVQVKPTEKLLLDQSLDEYVIPDLSYWFEDEWEEICARNSLSLPSSNEKLSIANTKSSLSYNLNKLPKFSETNITTVPLYQAVNFVNKMEKNEF